MITWDDFDKIWASTSPLTPYSFSDPNYAQGWNFIGSTPPARQMWDSIQKQNDEKFKYLRDNFGTPNIVTQASQMTDTDKVYVYLGSEAGWNSGHWYYYDEGTSSWADGGVYNSVAFVTDTTLSIAGQPADAKATGDALALKSDLAGCTFTGNVSVNADLSVTGDASIGTDLSVAGTSTLTGNVSANGDVTVTGDVSSANLTTSADATIGGDLSVTGASTLAGNITAGGDVVATGDVSADNISATTNGTVGGNLSVTGTSTLTGNINAGADITVVGDVSADNLTTTTNATVGGSLSVAGTSTLTGNVTTNGNINAVGDISSANLTTTNATIGGNATVTGDVSCANLTTSADASVGGDLTVTGDSTLADTTVDDLVVNNDLSVAGDSSLTNLSVSGTTALAGTSTAPTPSADDNSTKIATTEYVQTELKPIEVNADIVNKRVTNIEKLLQGNLYDYQTDTDSKYTKTVPQGAMPYASLDSIGGKTLVWNQLVDPSRLVSRGTVSSVGLTQTTDGNGAIIINGTSTQATNIYISNTLPLIGGHKYIIYCDKYSADWYFRIGSSDLDTSNGAKIASPLSSGNVLVYFNFASGVTFDNLSIRVQYTDLTLLYGAGNEPTTVAEFQQMFPAQYYPYNAGTLLSAGVTEVKSVGVNLFDPTAITDDAYLSTTTGLEESNNRYFVTDYIPVYAGQKVYIPNTGTLRRWFYDTNKTPTTYLADSGVQYYTPAQGGFIRVSVDKTQVDINTVIIAYVTSNTPPTYVPYNGHTYPIPAEIQALEGYGWSAGSVYNYIDYERKVFVKNVDRVVLDGTQYVGSINWRASENGVGWLYPYSLTNNKITDSTAIGNVVTDNSTIQASKFTSMYSYVNGITLNLNDTYGIIIRQSDTSLTTREAINAYLSANPITVYYELATPIETDISAYLTDDNLIEVEAGGTLTFPNSNGDDYRIPIPSSETYMVDLQEAI